MKQYVHILILTALTSLLCSCEIETSGNGDLDGMWHLVSIESLSGSEKTDMSHEKIYWSFQHRLLEFDDKTGLHQSILFRFEHKDNTLRLYDPYLYDRENGDEPTEDVEVLKPFGVENLEETFNVESLNGSRMILSSGTKRLNFIKM